MARYKTEKRWTRSDAAGILDDVDRSGLSDTAFAKRHAIDRQRLTQWRARLGRPHSQGRVARRKKTQGKRLPAVKSPPQFMEVRLASVAASTTVEIRLRNGRAVVVNAGIQDEALAQLLDLVERERC